jgi:hypothetical protein
MKKFSGRLLLASAGLAGLPLLTACGGGDAPATSPSPEPAPEASSAQTVRKERDLGKVQRAVTQCVKSSFREADLPLHPKNAPEGVLWSGVETPRDLPVLHGTNIVTQCLLEHGGSAIDIGYRVVYDNPAIDDAYTSGVSSAYPSNPTGTPKQLRQLAVRHLEEQLSNGLRMAEHAEQREQNAPETYLRTVANAESIAQKNINALVNQSPRQDAAQIGERHLGEMKTAVLLDALDDYFDHSGAKQSSAPPAAAGMPQALIDQARENRSPLAGHVLRLEEQLYYQLERVPASEQSNQAQGGERNGFDAGEQLNPPSGGLDLTNPLNPLSPMNPSNPLNPASPLSPFRR